MVIRTKSAVILQDFLSITTGIAAERYSSLTKPNTMMQSIKQQRKKNIKNITQNLPLTT